jgi:hypothetical protein
VFYEQYLFGAIFHQPVLVIECVVFLLRRRPAVAAIGLHDAQADVVLEIRQKNLFQVIRQMCRFFHREDELHPVVEVPLHQISGAQVNFLLAAVQEVIDAAVFQVSSNNRDHHDMVTHTLDAGSQRSHAAHQQVHFDPGLRGLIKKLDHPRIDQSIDLEDQAGVAFRFGMFDLAADERFQTLARVGRCDP